MRTVTVLLLAGLLVPGLALAGTTGKVAGVVKDRKAGESIPGANVALLGAGGNVVAGAVTDLKGNYTILNVMPGAYAVKCSFIGYRETVVRNVTALVDFTTTVDFAIESEAIQLGQAVEVVATRPLVQKDQTGSVRFASIEDIQNMPLRGYEAVTSLQAGVTDFGGAGLYVRGGRQEEVAYYVDGFSQQDPLTGVSRTAINNNAIDQVNIFVGGFSAEYGRSMSGVVNVVTKEGGAKYSGTFEAITDRPTSQGWLKTPSFGYNNYDGALSGPLIPNNDRITFYLSGERREREDRSPKGNVTASSIDSLMAYGTEKYLRAEDYNQLKKGILPQNDLEGWTWQGKLNIKVSNNVNLKVGVLGSKNIWNTYSHHYRYDLDHTAHNRDYNQSAFARLTYSVNSKTFLTLAGNYFLTRRESGDGRYFNNLKGYGRPKGNPNFDREALYYLGDNLATQDSLALDVGNNGQRVAGHQPGGPPIYDDRRAVHDGAGGHAGGRGRAGRGPGEGPADEHHGPQVLRLFRAGGVRRGLPVAQPAARHRQLSVAPERRGERREPVDHVGQRPGRDGVPRGRLRGGGSLLRERDHERGGLRVDRGPVQPDKDAEGLPLPAGGRAQLRLSGLPRPAVHGLGHRQQPAPAAQRGVRGAERATGGEQDLDAHGLRRGPGVPVHLQQHLLGHAAGEVHEDPAQRGGPDAGYPLRVLAPAPGAAHGGGAGGGAGPPGRGQQGEHDHGRVRVQDDRAGPGRQQPGPEAGGPEGHPGRAQSLLRAVGL